MVKNSPKSDPKNSPPSRPTATLDLTATEVEDKKMQKSQEEGSGQKDSSKTERAENKSAPQPDNKKQDKKATATSQSDKKPSPSLTDHKDAKAAETATKADPKKAQPAKTATQKAPPQPSTPAPSTQRSKGGFISHLFSAVIGGVIAFLGLGYYGQQIASYLPGFSMGSARVDSKLAAHVTTAENSIQNLRSQNQAITRQNKAIETSLVQLRQSSQTEASNLLPRLAQLEE